MTRRRIRDFASGPVLANVPSSLLWQPDYTSESNSISSGDSVPAQINQGFFSGVTWNRFQPPFVRGQAMSTRAAILTGTDVPGSVSDQFRPSACAHFEIQPTSAVGDFGIVALQSQSSTDTFVMMRLSDVQIDVGALGDGVAYPGGPVPNNNSISANIGESLTNQSNTTGSTGNSGTEHVRVNATIDYVSTQQITYEGPTITNGDSLTNVQGKQFTYNGVTITNGQTYTAVQVPVSRHQESTAGVITAGDVFIVATGDVNNQAGFSSRTEVYGRFPPSSPSPYAGGNTPDADWPDPVGSTRWYGISYYLPSDMDTLSGQGWFDCTQWKGQHGGSPPMALGINWTSSTANGRGNWQIEATSGHPSPQLGAIALGQWTRFAFGISWDYRAVANGGTGSIEVYRDGAQVVAQAAAVTMDSWASGSEADPIYLKNGIYRTIGWKTTHDIYISAPKVGASLSDVINS